jgi:hypothetical protein
MPVPKVDSLFRVDCLFQCDSSNLTKVQIQIRGVCHRQHVTSAEEVLNLEFDSKLEARSVFRRVYMSTTVTGNCHQIRHFQTLWQSFDSKYSVTSEYAITVTGKQATDYRYFTYQLLLLGCPTSFRSGRAMHPSHRSVLG